MVGRLAGRRIPNHRAEMGVNFYQLDGRQKHYAEQLSNHARPIVEGGAGQIVPYRRNREAFRSVSSLWAI
ncbi:hypothetical protein ACLOJK_001321 [Asimina triloba]